MEINRPVGSRRRQRPSRRGAGICHQTIYRDPRLGGSTLFHSFFTKVLKRHRKGFRPTSCVLIFFLLDFSISLCWSLDLTYFKSYSLDLIPCSKIITIRNPTKLKLRYSFHMVVFNNKNAWFKTQLIL